MSNNKDFMSFNTGGYVARHKQDEISVQVPQKTTGDVKEENQGFAKASPVFKKIEAEELSEEDKKKAIAKNKKTLSPVNEKPENKE